MKTIGAVIGSCIFVITVFFPLSLEAGEEILIGTGSRDGVYYYAGKAICRMVARGPGSLSCKVTPTPGSLYNLANVRDGGLDIGLVQSDWHYNAVNGTGPARFMAGSFDNLRSLFSLHTESVTLVVRRDAGITRFDQLPGHRVNIGNPGSGQRATMELLMDAMGWTKETFLLAEELNASEQSFALCNSRIDAMVYVVGHPNASVSKAAKLCNAVIVPVNGPVIEQMVAGTPYYMHTRIPGGLYQENPDPVSTFGLVATVVASSDLSDTMAYTIVKSVFEDLDTFRKLHPALGKLEPSRMVREGLSAQLHPGARQYFEEKGLL